MSLPVDVCIMVQCVVSDVSSVSNEMNVIYENSEVQERWLLIYMVTGSFTCYAEVHTLSESVCVFISVWYRVECMPTSPFLSFFEGRGL